MVHKMPSNSERLELWGLLDQSVDVYSLDGGLKCLIRWVSSDTLQMQITCDENGKILFARCSLHWCWCHLHAWEKVVLYLDTRYVSCVLALLVLPILLTCLCAGEKRIWWLGQWRSSATCVGPHWSTDCATLVRPPQAGERNLSLPCNFLLRVTCGSETATSK